MRILILRENIIEDNISLDISNDEIIVKIPFIQNQDSQTMINDICDFHDILLTYGELMFTFTLSKQEGVRNCTYKIFEEENKYDWLLYCIPCFMLTKDEMQYINTLCNIIQ